MKKILVAEDEQAIREFVVINLKRAGYDPYEAGNGEEALAIYEKENGAFDVYFTDASGTTYTAQVTKDMLETGGENALRTSIIIILCVIAVGIGAVYVLLVPKKPKN